MISPQTFDFAAGPDLTGCWKNYRTGQVVKIKDTLFEDNNLVGVTTTGQMINMNQLKDFVKYDPSKEEQAPAMAPSHPAPQKTYTDPDTLLRGLKAANPYSSVLGDNYLDDEYGPPETPTITSAGNMDIHTMSCETGIKKSDPDQMAIDRVLGDLKDNDIPAIDVCVRWTVPAGVKFLEDYLHISPEKIARSVIEKFASEQDIHDRIVSEIESVLGVKHKEEKILPCETNAVPDKPTPEAEPPVKPKPKASPAKKMKK